jgi:hypothetical protein
MAQALMHGFEHMVSALTATKIGESEILMKALSGYDFYFNTDNK